MTDILGSRREWFVRTLDLFAARGGRVIVEVGSLRIPGNYDGDGYSTLAWAASGQSVYSVDIDQAATALTIEETKHLPNVVVVNGDGIAFLKCFGEPIDLLYLDAWDVGAPEYKERHLEAFQAARLAHKALVLIDDCDVDGLGKGELVIPAAMAAGFSVVFQERQTLLARG